MGSKKVFLWKLFKIFFREALFQQSLRKLKNEVVKANALVREANLISELLWTKKDVRRGLTRYDVILQIPACNLRPSKIKVLFKMFYLIF